MDVRAGMNALRSDSETWRRPPPRARARNGNRATGGWNLCRCPWALPPPPSTVRLPLPPGVLYCHHTRCKDCNSGTKARPLSESELTRGTEGEGDDGSVKKKQEEAELPPADKLRNHFYTFVAATVIVTGKNKSTI